MSRPILRMRKIREDFVDPAITWDAELISPIPKIVGTLFVFACAFGVIDLLIHYAHALIAALLAIGLSSLGQIVTAAGRLRAYRRYEAWLVAPQPAPRHLGPLAAGVLLVAVITLEAILCWRAW